MHRPAASLPILAALAFVCPAVRAEEAPGVSARIDRIVQKRLDDAKVPASPLADDAEFLRRVYLDLTGRIPTYDQTRAFLDSKAADKRAKLIDELLARPEFGHHLATVWRELIVDRSPEQNQARDASWEFINWLADGFNKDAGWNDLVTQMLTAEGEAKKNPAATFLLANRMNDFPRPEELVGTTGRLFMGIHIRCAQCHDHPSVDGWKQDDFWGMAAFFAQLRDHGLTGMGPSRNPDFREFANPDPKKEQTYLNRMKRAGLVAPERGPLAAIPSVADPSKPLRVVKARFFLQDAPKLEEKGPYRPRFAAWLTSGDNPYFAKATANRLWAHFFAAGIVNPVDDMSPARTPSHPELLDLLAAQLKAGGFKYKGVIRAVCNSQTYQRTSRPLPGNKDDRRLFSHMPIRQLSADQMLDSLCVAVGRAIPTGKNRDTMTLIFATRDASDSPTELSHGVPQFLHQMNAGVANGNRYVANRYTQGKKTKEEAVRSIYLGVLSRDPKPGELAKAVAFVEKSSNPQLAYRDVLWVLANSAEFMFNR